MIPKEQEIKQDDFLRMFDCPPDAVTTRLLSGLAKVDTEYRVANKDELAEYVLDVLKTIESPRSQRTTDENIAAWEKGWTENLEAIRSGNFPPKDLNPRYFRGNKFLRYNKKLIVSDNLNLEHDLFTYARYLMFNKHLSSFENIYELGCGSCQNLWLLSELFPTMKLFGLDWAKASVDIANSLCKHQKKNITGVVFDMMNPSPEIVIEPNSAVVTIHALEQIGTQHEKLLSFLLDAKPGLVLHYEPIVEFYDQNDLVDYLAVIYSKRRKYLSGLWTALGKLQQQKKIEVVESKRPYLGGVIHESSLIVWKPL